jgi:hypothetical protein
MDEEKIIRMILWMLAHPNSYIDGQLPMTLLRADGENDDRLVSLIKAFLHPADVF